MASSLLRGATVGAAVAVTIGLASALAACASTTTNANGVPVGAAGAASSTISGAAPTPPTSAPASGAPTSVNPGGPIRTAPATPLPTSPPASLPAQTPLSTRPANAKYVPVDQETQSADGRTLYLEIEAHGGACGQYVVVLQQAASDVHVGLAQIQPKVGVMCPMYIGPRTFPVKLSAPVGTRAVIDLATGKRLGS